MNNISSVGETDMNEEEEEKEGARAKRQGRQVLQPTEEGVGLPVRLVGRRVWLCCVALLADCASQTII